MGRFQKSLEQKHSGEPIKKADPGIKDTKKETVQKPARKKTESVSQEKKTSSQPKKQAATPVVPKIDDLLNGAEETRTRRVQLVVKPSDYEKWRALAKSHNISLNELIIRCMNSLG